MLAGATLKFQLCDFFSSDSKFPRFGEEGYRRNSKANKAGKGSKKLLTNISALYLYVFGFRHRKSIVDQIVLLIENREDFFVYLTVAYDSVRHCGLS